MKRSKRVQVSDTESDITSDEEISDDSLSEDSSDLQTRI